MMAARARHRRGGPAPTRRAPPSTRSTSTTTFAFGCPARPAGAQQLPARPPGRLVFGIEELNRFGLYYPEDADQRSRRASGLAWPNPPTPDRRDPLPHILPMMVCNAYRSVACGINSAVDCHRQYPHEVFIDLKCPPVGCRDAENNGLTMRRLACNP